ncbi:gene transfer agent family protein [Mesorhizobium sp. BR1-1-3]|uniref:gene transfer agent family protein n=1 Tax=Mesorhizobium sp. BR1-1-3 TaxID=2876651 RepID=UPI001CD175CE|nr:gene transfer agent family protein [Mesorhizobium sp. BR1-1-3]MBZ9888127.1 gene transfer agent family protein [Mesorhizobium sp. BR1-1-3]
MRSAEEVVWPGGIHQFRLAIGELRAIEQKCDAGCFVVMMRLLSSQCKIDDVLAPIRLGLIGGGMLEKDAQRLVDSVLAETASPYTLTVTAAEILRRFLMWDGEDQSSAGEQKAGAETPDPR